MGDLTALLLDAKAEYRYQMEEIVTPSIVDTINGMWRQSQIDGGSRDAVLMFQQRLREIPGWNANIVSNKTREITYVYPYFDDLIAACIIAQLKIMSSIKLSQDKPTVQLKLPSTETFLHEVYIQTAKRVYEDPFMMQQKTASPEVILAPVVSDAIERTIRKLIPFKDVLVAYLQGGGDQNVAREALKTRSDGSSGGSFPKGNDDDDDIESSDSSEDEDVRVPMGDPEPVRESEPMGDPLGGAPVSTAPSPVQIPPLASDYPQYDSPPPHQPSDTPQYGVPLQTQSSQPSSQPPPQQQAPSPPPPPSPPQQQQGLFGDQSIRHGF
jgi:hypothetical protein